MRVDLNCPYAEKDQAKAAGARWDPVRKTWYVSGIEDLTPFEKWLPTTGTLPASGPNRPTKGVNALPAVVTQSPARPHCGCVHIPAWEHCEHTA